MRLFRPKPISSPLPALFCVNSMCSWCNVRRKRSFFGQLVFAERPPLLLIFKFERANKLSGLFKWRIISLARSDSSCFKPVAKAFPASLFIGMLWCYGNIGGKSSFLRHLTFAELMPFIWVFESKRANKLPGFSKWSIRPTKGRNCICSNPITQSFPARFGISSIGSSWYVLRQGSQ